jgi:CrcB protein
MSIAYKLLLIACGGAIGAVLRYLLSGWAQGWVTGSVFPLGTLVVNMVGCFVIGMLSALFTVKLVPAEYRPIILIGVIGAFTTFSTFGLETFQLLRDKEVGLAMLNVVLSNVAGLAAVWLGYRMAERVYGVA